MLNKSYVILFNLINYFSNKNLIVKIDLDQEHLFILYLRKDVYFTYLDILYDQPSVKIII